MPSVIDRETRLAKLVSSACFGNKDISSAAEQHPTPTSTAAKSARSSSNVPALLTADGSYVAPDGASSSSGAGIASAKSAPASSSKSQQRVIRGGAHVLGTGKAVSVNPTENYQRPGRATAGKGFTPSFGRAAVTVEQSRTATRNSHLEHAGASATAAVRDELASLYKAHHSSEGEARRPGAPAGAGKGKEKARGASTGPALPPSGAKGNSLSVAGGGNIRTLQALTPSSAASSRARGSLRNTTAAYRQQQGTTATTIDQVGAATMTPEQRERVAKARKTAGKDDPASCCVAGRSGGSNVHTLGAACSGNPTHIGGCGKPVTTGGRCGGRVLGRR
eukprot:g14735.t1